MAHFDPMGRVGPHVQRQVEALAAAFEDVVVVSVAQLDDTARAWLKARAELVERANYGYDFFSYRAALHGRDLSPYDEVVICNDSYVGPLRPYSQILQEMADRPVDFWGLADSERGGHHVQSFFVGFRGWVVGSQAFTRFWEEMEPISDRLEVIRRYEIGLSTTLHRAGFASGAYFDATPTDSTVGRRRVRWWSAHRQVDGRVRPGREVLRRWAGEPYNSSTALADRALDAGRLPYVKIDTLRYDPYGLDSDRLLRLCENRYADEFDGVRAFLDATSDFYPPRKAETLRRTPLHLMPLRPVVRYDIPRPRLGS